MRVLLITDSYPPEIRSASHLMFELAEDLTGRGHEVTVLTCLPRYNLSEIPRKYQRKLLCVENEDGITVIRAGTLPIHHVGPLMRGLGQLSLPVAFTLAGLLGKRQDVIATYSPPLTLGLASYLLGSVWNAPFVFNVQDLFPQNAIDLGVLKGRFAIDFFQKLERFIYKRARFITVHSPGNRDHILSLGEEPEKVVVIHNWVDMDMLKPSDRQNRYRRENGLDENFVVLFAGVMGYAQDLDTVIESASLLREHPDITFLLVGDGVEKKGLMEKARSLGLSHVRFLPFVSREDYPELVGASDVCLATLRKTMRTPVVPSKILSIMAAGRPLVASLPLDGDAPKVIDAAQCGYCVEPENPERLSRAILKLYNDPSLRETMGKNGRRYAERHFSRTLCSRKYEELLLEACRSHKASF